MSDPSSPASSAAHVPGSSPGSLPRPAPVRRWKSVWFPLLIFAAGLTIGACGGLSVGTNLFFRLFPPHPSPETLRAHWASVGVQNRSPVDFRRVFVNGESFGDIRSGESTEFHSMQRVYRYAGVDLDTPSGPMTLGAIDFVGERQLSEGSYMYVLTIEDGKLVMDCVVIR